MSGGFLFLFLNAFFRGCSCLNCTNQARSAPSKQTSTLYIGFFRGAVVSARLCRLPEQELHQPRATPTKQELLQYSSVGALGTSAPPESTSLKASRRPIGFRPPSDQIPSAARSDSVRRPIGFCPPSDRIPSAVRSDILKSNQPSTEHLH